MTLKDEDIREPLFDFLDETYGEIRILEEKTIGKSRADVVMVTRDALYGLEIKSDADTYERLSRQVKDYDKFFDYNCVVVGTSHAHHIEEHVPKTWGIITVELDENEDFDFYILRKPERNAKRKMKYKLSLLWRNELEGILKKAQMRRYTSKSKKFIAEKIMDKVTEEELDPMISDELFERDYSRFEDEE